MRAWAPHHNRDDAVDHFNKVFRHRYRLRFLMEAEAGAIEVPSDWDDLPDLEDAGCAVLARAVASLTPRFSFGIVDGHGQVFVLSDEKAWHETAPAGLYVLIENPAGNLDNWSAVQSHFRRRSQLHWRSDLAGLASEKRPDQTANLALLDDAARTHGRAIVLPPDEGYSSARAEETGFIYERSPETLRLTKRGLRPSQSGRRAGRPRGRKPVENSD